MIALEARWLNASTLQQSNWMPANPSSSTKISTKTDCGGSSGTCLGGYTVFNVDGGIIQQFDVEWGGGNNDGLFNFSNVSILNVKALADYAYTGNNLLTAGPNSKYDMTLRSGFAAIQGGFYRDQLVQISAQLPILKMYLKFAGV